jgi:hypothetical protein
MMKRGVTMGGETCVMALEVVVGKEAVVVILVQSGPTP